MKTTAWLKAALGGVALGAAMLFCAASGFTLFRCRTPLDWLLLPRPQTLLAIAWTCAAAHWALNARRASGGPRAEEPARALTPAGRWALLLALVALVAVLWMRCCLWNYRGILLRVSHEPHNPFWQVHLVFASVLAGVLGLWRAGGRTGALLGVVAGGVVLAASPLSLDKDFQVSIAYAVTMSVWIAGTRLAARREAGSAPWLCTALAACAMVAALCVRGAGAGPWSPRGAWEVYRLHVAPRLGGLLQLAGVLALAVRRPRLSSPLLAALAVAAGGMVLAGGQGALAQAGAVALVPLGAVLTAAGANGLWLLACRSRAAACRNVVLLTVLGLCLGILRFVMYGSVRVIDQPPAAIEKAERAAAPSSMEDEDAHE